MITSTATMTEIRNEYADTAEPWLSVEQCQRFLRACSILIMRLPAESASREGSFKYEIGELTKQQVAARQWLAANGGASAPSPQRVVIRPDFSNSRG